MSPWRRVLAAEWWLARRQRGLWGAAAMVLLLVAASIAAGTASTRARQATTAALRADEVGRWTAMREELQRAERGEVALGRLRHPGAPAWAGGVGRHAVLPPRPLAVLGVSESVPAPVRVTLESLPPSLTGAAGDPVSLVLGGGVDTAFVVVVCLSLLILALTYDALAGERERATVGLLRAQPISLASLVASRVAVRVGLLLATALGATVGGVGFVGVGLRDGEIMRDLAFLSLAVVFYGLFWGALAVAVNAIARSPATSAVALLATWLGVVVLVPSAIQTAATLTHPLPSRTDLVVAARDIASGLDAEARQVLARRAGPSPHESSRVAGPLRAALQQAVLEEHEERLAPLLAPFEAQRAGREAMMSRLRPLSPALMLQAVFDELTGAGQTRLRAFLGQLADYHRRWREFFRDRLYRGESLTSADYLRVPEFTFVEEPPGRRTRRLLAHLTALGLAAGCSSAMAFGLLRRRPRDE